MKTQEKLKIAKTFSIMVDKAKKRQPKDTTVIHNLGLYLLTEWRDLALPLITQADNIKATQSSIDKYIKKVDAKMAKFGKTIKKRVDEDFNYIYRYSKASDAKRFSTLVSKAKRLDPPEIAVGFWTEADLAAIEAIQIQTTAFANTFYSGSVQTAVAESVKVTIFEQGLTLEQAGEALQKDLMRVFRLKKGALESKVVPKGFRGTAGQYFNGLAETQAQVSRTASSLYALSDAGADKFVIRSVKSDRTCQGCFNMDGQEFTVQRGINHIQKFMEAESKEDLKEIQPAFHYKVPGENSEAKEKEAKKLLSDGKVRVSPFHFKCECYIDQV